jgi:hypothetical protein
MMPARRFTCCLIIALSLALSGPALAQSGTIKFRTDSSLVFDCEDPVHVKDYGVRASLTGALNADRSASADLAISGFMLSTNVHFDARLGRSSLPAPGGSSQLHVLSRDRIRAVWNLPNNNLIMDFSAAGRSCSAVLTIALKPGKKQYSMYGGKFYYCSSARVLNTSCEAQ